MRSGLSLAGNGSFHDELAREPEERSRLSPDVGMDDAWAKKPEAAAGWQRVHKTRSEERTLGAMSKPMESNAETNSVNDKASRPNVSRSCCSSSSACWTASGIRSSCNKSANDERAMGNLHNDEKGFFRKIP